MPTTLTGVLLFVVLLLPGFAYQVGKGRRGTERTTSALRETAAEVAASVASEIFLLAATSWLWSRYIDFGRLVREPRKYWLCEPATIVWWAIGSAARRRGLFGTGLPEQRVASRPSVAGAGAWRRIERTRGRRATPEQFRPG